VRGRDPPSRGPRRDRRAERRHRGLRAASRRGARGLPRGDRHAEGDHPALEERDLRRRRGMDREGIVKRALERMLGGAAVIAGTALKWGFIFAKFFGFFISAAAYSFWFHSWTFG